MNITHGAARREELPAFLAVSSTLPTQVGPQLIVGAIPAQPVGVFVTRSEVRDLRASLQSSGSAISIVTGMRGIGKTHVAAAYAREAKHAGYDLVAWIDAETPESLWPGLDDLALALGVADPHGVPSRSARLVRDELNRRQGRLLLVFDNAEDRRLLSPLVPTVGNVEIIITTTELSFESMGVSVPVREYPLPESIDYLVGQTQIPDRNGAARLAEELGRHALALAVAAGTIALLPDNSFDAYIERVSTHPVRVTMDSELANYRRTAYAALDMSVEAIIGKDPFSEWVLGVVAVLSLKGVDVDTLSRNALAQQFPDGDIHTTLTRCVRTSVLQRTEDRPTVSMHRLLARVVIDRAEALGTKARLLEIAGQLLREDVATPMQFGQRREAARSADHAHSLLDNLPEDDEDVSAAGPDTTSDNAA